MMETPPIRVVLADDLVLADDHAVVRKGIREFLEEEGDIQVVAEADDGEQALAHIAELRPDVAVLDIQMPGLTGIEVTRRVKADYPDVKVLMLTAYDYDPYIFAALQAGANGYVLKTARSHQLTAAVRTVHDDGTALDPTVTRKVVEHMASGSPYARAEGMVERPSEREMDVLRLVARGFSNRAIGRELGISDRTVQGHLANLFGKLGVATRTEAALLAVKMGWINLDETV
jgi:DNA-binding NarL/FixJ family response regulator